MENKYNVGDKIIKVKAGNSPESEIGAVYTVTEVDGDVMKTDEGGSFTLGYIEENYEPVASEAKFKKGDIVKFKSSDSMNAEFFEKGLNNLEIHSYDSDLELYNVHESDKSTTWLVQEYELMLDTDNTSPFRETEIVSQKALIADAQRVLAAMFKAEKEESKVVEPRLKTLKEVDSGWYKVRDCTGELTTVYKEIDEDYISMNTDGDGLLILSIDNWENSQVVSECEPFDWE
jgi:hypothetical protein